jgi:hypothetical protein
MQKTMLALTTIVLDAIERTIKRVRVARKGRDRDRIAP